MLPPKYQWRRYQAIIVNRDDELAVWMYDLGPSAAFGANQFTFPLEWEHTVEEARDMAEQQRHDNFWRRFLAEKQSESTLIEDFVNQKEEYRKIIHNQSVFGPGGFKSRIGFPRRAVLEKEKK